MAPPVIKDMTATEYQTLIEEELNLSTYTTVTDRIVDFWNLHYSRTSDVYLTYLYTKKACLIALLAIKWTVYDVSVGFDTLKKSQTFKQLRELLSYVDDEITRLDPAYMSRLGVVKRSSQMPLFGGVLYTDEERTVYSMIYGSG